MRMDLNYTYSLVALAVQACSVHDVGGGCLVVEWSLRSLSRNCAKRMWGGGVDLRLFFFFFYITTYATVGLLT